MGLERRDSAGGAVDTTITAGINGTDLSISIASSTGWPSGGANGPFFVIVDYDVAGKEKIEVASRTGTTLTVANTSKRGVDGTSAAAHASGAKIRHCHTRQDTDEANRTMAETIGRLTTKGDLTPATGANATTRLAAGANNTVLIADSTQAGGLRWGTLAAGATIPAAATPSTQAPDDAATVGVSTDVARSDHKHAITAAAASTITGVNSEGAAANFARSDHNHVIGGTNHIPIAALVNGSIANGAAALAANQQLIYSQATNPGAVGAGRIWFNTASGKRAMLVRNAGDTAWEVWEAMDWIPYTPTYPGVSLGNAIHFARYIRKGGLVAINGFFRIGSTTSFAGLTNLTITLPPNAQAKDLDSFVGYPGTPTAEFHGHGAARAHDDSLGQQWAAVGLVPNAGAAKALDRIAYFATGGTSQWSQTVPITWAANDRFTYFVEYEPATLEDTNWV